MKPTLRTKPGRKNLLLGLVLLLAMGIPAEPWCAARKATVPVAEEATPESRLAASSAPERGVHLARLGVDRWHKAGVRGKNLKIALLDSGFRDYRSLLGKAMPDRVRTRSFRQDHNLEGRESQHGLFCAEILHLLAPEAELLLTNWEPDRPQTFLEAVRWAREQGARIISCSLIMPSWSDGEGGGSVHSALERLLGSGDQPGDILFFACAGNTAQRHWAGKFQPDSQGYHSWASGKVANKLRPWGQDRVAVELYGPIGGEYDLQVWDVQTDTLVGHAPVQWGFADSPQGKIQEKKGGGTAVVRFLPNPVHSYEVRLKGPCRPAREEKFHLVVLGGTLEHGKAQGSIAFPGDGACVQTVGAIDGEGRRLFYSSCGPNSRLPKPDFVAPVPFPTSFRDRPFSGTSAAAPQAAGLAALWWSKYPDWTASRVRQAMRASARDLGPPGHDWETGYGMIHLP